MMAEINVFASGACCARCGMDLLKTPFSGEELAAVQKSHICPVRPITGEWYTLQLDALVKDVKNGGRAFVETRYIDGGSQRVLWVGWDRLMKKDIEF